LRHEVQAQGLSSWVEIRESPCFGHCSQGPIIRWVGSEIYSKMSRQGVLDLVNSLRIWLQEQGVDLSIDPTLQDPEHESCGPKAAFLLPPI
jgi:(2Fe-2S) ferredoxin